ncbi:FHA domain-containing protein [Streptomyces daliensis]
MQIRLTVALGPRGGQSAEAGSGAACDVVVTAPAGTVLAAVTGALASTAASAVASGGAAAGAGGAVSGAPGAGAGAAGAGAGAAGAGSGSGAGEGGGRGERRGKGGAAEHGSEPVAVYVGTERLDPHRQVLGEPPLLDGAVVSLHGPAAPSPASAAAYASALSAYGSAKARLHVVSGPDAGGVHLLQGGKVTLGRSAEADVPLDDPDVSRLHCAVTVTDGGAVTVTDLGSTNGTSVDGAPVGGRPALFQPGATLRIGESAVRLEASGTSGAGAPGDTPPALPVSLATVPDGKGRLRLAAGPDDGPGAGAHAAGAGPWEAGAHASAVPPRPSADPSRPTHSYAPGAPFPGSDRTHGAGFAAPLPAESEPERERRRARGLGAWARRFTGVRGEDEADTSPTARPTGGPGGPGGPGRPGGHADGPEGALWPGADAGPWDGSVDGPAHPYPASGSPLHGARGTATSPGKRWPDPAGVLLTALGPGPRLWERGPGHPAAMTVRLGSAHRSGGRPGEPVTVDLRGAGALGLAGPRSRLAGMARSVVAQLAALHGPSTLEIVLLSADRARPSAARTAEWSWLGWLPHVRPAHGQDCRLLTAYDRDQAAARTTELTRRLDQERTDRARALRAAAPGALGVPGAPGVPGSPSSPSSHGNALAEHPGPYTLLIVDGDPGSAALREAVARLAVEGPAAGIHALCLAEAPAASPASPLDATIEAAHAASPVFRECGTLALLSGAVATAVRLVRRAPGDQGTGPVWEAGPGHGAGGHGSGVPEGAASAGGTVGAGGTVATIDAVSAAWAERFARALAPLREAEGAAVRTGKAARAAVTLPRNCRLLDELGLARATPAALLARWSEQPDGSAAGRASLVFGAGPRGPVEAELSGAGAGTGAPGAGAPGARGGVGGHLLVTGPVGSGKTELLRSLAAALAAGERPERLRLFLLDGEGDAAREGLRPCCELPHVTGHLAAGGPVRMREFAQALSAELKRRDGLIGPDGTYEEHHRAAALAHTGRVVSQRTPPGVTPPGPAPSGSGEGAGSRAPVDTGAQAAARGGGDIESDATRGTLRLRTRTGTTGGAGGPTPPTGTGPGQATAPGEGGSPDGEGESRAASRAVPAQAQAQAQAQAHGDQVTQTARTAQAAQAPQGTVEGHGTGTGQATGQGAAQGEASVVESALSGPEGDTSLPRLVIVVDDFDTLVDPALGNPGRPAAGSVVRALEAVARDGARLGVHLVAASGRPDRTAGTLLARTAGLHAELTGSAEALGPTGGVDADDGADEDGEGRGAAPQRGGPEAVPGRGVLHAAGDEPTAFQAGRVTGRIPRTSTLRPTVVPLDWARAGDPPARRPVRELGNGPTDLALLASAVARAAQSLTTGAASRSRTGQDDALDR